MADREETLLFIVDVQVRNAKALQALDADFDAAAATQQRRLLALNDNVAQRYGDEVAQRDAVSMPGSPTGNGNRYRPGMVLPGGQGSFSGARGKENIGSRQNPMVMAAESGQAAGLGGLAAADAATSVSSQGGGSGSSSGAGVAPAQVNPIPTPSQKSWLDQAAQSVADKVAQPEDDRVVQAIASAAQLRKNTGDSLTNAAQAVQQATAEQPALAEALASARRSRQGSQGTFSPQEALAAAEAVQAAQIGPGWRSAPRAVPRSTRTLDSGEAAGRLGVTRSQVYEMASTGRLNGAQKNSAGQWTIPEQSILDMLATGGGNGGGRGGGRPPVARGGPSPGNGGGRGGGGGSRTFWTPWGGTRTQGDEKSPFSFGNLFRGDEGRGGAFGLPGFGSVGSLAGLGLEHWLLTGLGLGASAGSAVGGAGLLGTAGLSQMLVGGGADALVSKTTLDNAKQLNTAVEALQTAVGKYGANSSQAEKAQAALNAQMKQLGGGVGAQAEVQLDQDADSLKRLFETTSSGAQQQSAEVMDQVVKLGTAYTPMVVQAAQRNLQIVNQGLKPLFQWLEGPDGMQVVQTLENAFARNLPTAIHAFDMGIEDFLRLMAAASQYTGGLGRDLDNLFTSKNQESTAQYDEEVQKLVGDLKEWEALLKVLGQDVSGIFKADAGTANSIVGSLTAMLTRLHEWETSTTGQMQLQNIFYVHKQEILQLLKLLPDLLKGYGQFYLDVAPPLVDALTDIAGAINAVLSAVEKIPGGAELVGLVIVLAKLGALAPALKATAAAMGMIGKSEEAMAAAGAVGGGEAAAGGVAAGGAARAAATGGASALEEGGAGVAFGGIASKIPGLAQLAAGTGSAVETGSTALAFGAADAGYAGLASSIAGAGAAIAPLAAGLVPLLAAAGGVYGLIQLFNLFSSGTGPSTTYTGNQLAQLLQQNRRGVLNQSAAPGSGPVRIAPAAGSQTRSGGIVVAGRGGALNPEAGLNPLANTTTVGQLAPTPQAQQALVTWLKTMSNAGDVAHMNATQLQGMVNEGDRLAQIFPKASESIDKFTDRAKEDLAPLQTVMKVMGQRWNSDLVDELDGFTRQAGLGLGRLVDIFDSNTKLIAHEVGLNSAQGEQLMHGNVQKMVADVTKGMLDGKVSVSAGMTAIQQALTSGLRDDAITWSTQWRDMFSTVQQLYAAHKIDTQTYLTDIETIQRTSVDRITGNTVTSYKTMFGDLKQQYANGILDQQQLNAKTKQLQNQSASSMVSYAENVIGSMEAAGAAGGGGMTAILDSLNKALKALGAAPIPLAQLGGGAAYDADIIKQTSMGYLPHGATGMRVNAPMYVVGEEAPNHPEYVLATNPAYRTRNLGLWAQAGSALGVPGFAKGGIAAGVAEANWINSQHFPYEWGGGHNMSFSPSPGEAGGPTSPGVGYDCSGSVSAVLHSMGLLDAPEVASQFMSYGLPGPGPVTLYASPTHVFMSLDGRFFGTHGSSGAGWYDGSALPGFVERHPPNIGAGQIRAPSVHASGAIKPILQSALSKATKAANSKLTKAMLATVAGGQAGGGDWGTFSGVLSGSVEKQVDEFFSSKGFNRTAIAGMLGNAWQESSMDPNEAGGGLWQQVSNFGQGTGGTLLNQMEEMLPQIAGLKKALNAAGSPGAAATLFMDDFEKPNAALANLPRRIAGANAAYAGGFAKGGVVTAHRPTFALFGENGTETAMFMPHYAGGGIVGQGSSTAASGQSIANAIHEQTHLITVLNNELTKLTNTFSNEQSTWSNLSSLTGALQGVASGTSLKSLGLSGSVLKSVGLSAGQAKSLIGGGAAGFNVLAGIDAAQESKERGELNQLKSMYAQAVKTHNTKLQKSILAQMSTIDGQLVTTIADGTSNLVSAIQAKGQSLDTVASNTGIGGSILSTIENLAPGTSLAGLGLTPSMLATLGLPSNATSLEGTGNTYLSGLQSSQGGTLTAAQMAAAVSGNNAVNTNIAGQITGYEGEVSYDESQLPKLTGTNKTALETTIGNLIGTISGLIGTMQDNTNATTALTSATTSNTTATTSNTGAMTGSVAFQYGSGGQTFLGSDRVMSLPVGN